MIVDKLINCEKYTRLNPFFAQAFAFLQHLDIGELVPGRIDIAGDELYAIVVNEEGWGETRVRMESHIQYIDIQYQVCGQDKMGYASTEDLQNEVDERRDDFIFYKNPPKNWIQTFSGYMAIFFPEDAHAPMGGTGRQFKVVVKVKA